MPQNHSIEVAEDFRGLLPAASRPLLHKLPISWHARPFYLQQLMLHELLCAWHAR